MTDPLPDGTCVRDPASDADFGTGWYAYWVTKPINLDQLLFEFRVALGDAPDAQLTTVAYGSTSTGSAADPVHFYWRPDTGSTVSPDEFITVVTAHTADWAWNPDVPTIAAVKAKAAAGTMLTSDDIQVGLVYLLNASEA